MQEAKKTNEKKTPFVFNEGYTSDAAKGLEILIFLLVANLRNDSFPNFLSRIAKWFGRYPVVHKERTCKVCNYQIILFTHHHFGNVRRLRADIRIDRQYRYGWDSLQTPNI